MYLFIYEPSFWLVSFVSQAVSYRLRPVLTTLAIYETQNFSRRSKTTTAREDRSSGIPVKEERVSIYATTKSRFIFPISLEPWVDELQ